MAEGVVDLIAELTAELAPDRVLTAGAEYEQARERFLTPLPARPAVIARCRSAAEVQAAVRASVRHGVPLVVRGGGHDLFGRSLRDGALVVDLALMREVRVRADEELAVAEGGALSSDVVEAAEAHGLTAVSGTAGSVGVAGLTLGGGYGPLVGSCGLAADNLLGAEVVLADGSLVDTDDDPELLWALRGGGGNLGVVTALRLRLHPVPTVRAGTITYPVDAARTVLRGLEELRPSLPDALSVDTALPPGPDGAPLLVLMPTWSGEPGAEDPITPLTTLAEPLAVEIGDAPRSALLRTIDAMFPFGARSGRFRTRNLAGVTDAVAEALLHAAGRFTSPFSAIMLHPLHGAAARVPSDGTAFAERSVHLMVEIIASWDPEDSPVGRHAAWAEELWEALGPLALPGGYVNLLDDGDREQIAHAYAGNTARLLALKDRLDPHRRFAATPLPSGDRATD